MFKRIEIFYYLLVPRYLIYVTEKLTIVLKTFLLKVHFRHVQKLKY
jgi:hypothetical protein